MVDLFVVSLCFHTLFYYTLPFVGQLERCSGLSLFVVASVPLCFLFCVSNNRASAKHNRWSVKVQLFCSAVTLCTTQDCTKQRVQKGHEQLQFPLHNTAEGNENYGNGKLPDGASTEAKRNRHKNTKIRSDYTSPMLLGSSSPPHSLSRNIAGETLNASLLMLPSSFSLWSSLASRGSADHFELLYTLFTRCYIQGSVPLVSLLLVLLQPSPISTYTFYRFLSS